MLSNASGTSYNIYSKGCSIVLRFLSLESMLSCFSMCCVGFKRTHIQSHGVNLPGWSADRGHTDNHSEPKYTLSSQYHQLMPCVKDSHFSERSFDVNPEKEQSFL